MAIVGEILPSYTINQINRRQTLHGSGVNTEFRSDNQLDVLNANTSWIKLASGISVTDSKRLTEIGFSQTEVEENKGLGLAKRNILFGGVASLVDVNGRPFDKLKQRDGFLPREANSSYTYGSFGFSPMPGIESADIKTLNRGSLKKATVKLKANNRQQFEILDLLYMRLGYTVLLEWGNSLFIDNEYGQKTVLRSTLIEDEFFTIKESNGSYLDILPRIEAKRDEWSANYDGILGKVSNFNWSFNVDGSYDIELTIISLGDVIESLKTNLSVDKGTLEFIKVTSATQPTSNTPNTENPDETPPAPDVLEDNKSANTISSMLYVWKYLNNGGFRGNLLTIKSADDQTYTPGSFLVPTPDEGTEGIINVENKTVKFTVTYTTKKEQAAENNANYETVRTSNEEANVNPNLTDKF